MTRLHIIKIRLMSSVLFMPTDVIVTLPDDAIRDGRRRRVLWLLHGARGDCKTALQTKEFARAMEGRDMMAVLPSALNSDYGNYPAFGTGYRFADFFFEELMPFVFATFPASERPQDQYIVGASMGGYGAMALGLFHPEKFAGIGAFGSSLRDPAFLEPYMDLPSDAFRRDAAKSPRAFPTEYGQPDAGIKLKEVNVIAKYPTARAFTESFECMWNRFPEAVQGGKLPKIYVACGTEDLFYPTTKDFERMARELGVRDIRFHFAQGVGHSEEFFDRQLGECLDWMEGGRA